MQQTIGRVLLRLYPIRSRGRKSETSGKYVRIKRRVSIAIRGSQISLTTSFRRNPWEKQLQSSRSSHLSHVLCYMCCVLRAFKSQRKLHSDQETRLFLEYSHSFLRTRQIIQTKSKHFGLRRKRPMLSRMQLLVWMESRIPQKHFSVHGLFQTMLELIMRFFVMSKRLA